MGLDSDAMSPVMDVTMVLDGTLPAAPPPVRYVTARLPAGGTAAPKSPLPKATTVSPVARVRTWKTSSVGSAVTRSLTSTHAAPFTATLTEPSITDGYVSQ